MDPEIERKWQRKWAEARLFEPHVDASRPKFLITVPWPYTNGSLHVGHGRTYTLADIIARYKRTRGFNVLFPPMAFHQSGTPIIAFSERLRNREKKIEEQYISYLREYEDEGRIPELLEKFQDPKAIADYFSNAIVNDFSALGYSIDWTRRFTSADEVYQDFVKWQFEKLNSMGYIKQGSHPVLYSVRDENAVGEDDIADGDVDKVTIEEFTGVIFSGRDFDIVAASLRPETIFGITNLWISPSAQYVLMELEGRRVVVSREASEKLGYQYRGARVIRPVEKAEVMGASFRVPITAGRSRCLNLPSLTPPTTALALFTRCLATPYGTTLRSGSPGLTWARSRSYRCRREAPLWNHWKRRCTLRAYPRPTS
ncbi:class I tRNA ligase family protein [Thermogymnomonas acidicola]|uniref:class I tRNA ligase family protein n=1 Tax=Thermogymnomonas acidicola TaxID=399579 RepID=UPI001493F0D5|nr:class I tRNA ligase family protein [Thermogymnomonas acidicola]